MSHETPVARGLYSAYALLQPLHEDIARQIDANEYHFAHSLLILVPRLPQIAAHQLVHALKNHFALGAFHVQHAFVAQHARPINVDNGAQEIFEFGRVKGTVGFEYKAFDIIVMVMVVSVAMAMRVVMVAVVVMGM